MSGPRPEGPDPAGLWRELAPQTLAALVRGYGSAQFDLCEDAVQEALLDAHRQWPDDPPSQPLGWLITTARRRYVDLVRSDQRRRLREEREALLDLPLAGGGSSSSADDTLLLLQLCCHPDVPRSGQIPLTLRAVAGLGVAQIANLLQLPEPTVGQRITRAKRRIAASGRLPRPETPDERLPQVLNVLYLMITEAHHTTFGEPAHDHELAGEAIRLARQVHAARPDDREVAGLLALLLLTESRHPARIGPDGALIPLAEQDRSRWDRSMIDEALRLLDRAVPGADPGPYLLQACIAALHARAPDPESTDWVEILALYRVLEIVTARRNPTVTLNRIVAAAMAEGLEPALADLDRLRQQHPDLPRLPAVRAHLLERAGRHAEAVETFREALRSTRSAAERQHLLRRLSANLEASAGDGGETVPAPG